MNKQDVRPKVWVSMTAILTAVLIPTIFHFLPPGPSVKKPDTESNLVSRSTILQSEESRRQAFLSGAPVVQPENQVVEKNAGIRFAKKGEKAPVPPTNKYRGQTTN